MIEEVDKGSWRGIPGQGGLGCARGRHPGGFLQKSSEAVSPTQNGRRRSRKHLSGEMR